MSQVHRFYVPDLAEQPTSVALPDDEQHHALRVVRVRAGQRIQLFDGAGRFCEAEVVSAGRRELVVERGEVHEEQAPAAGLTLAQAWLNHERSVETIVEQGTALGVDRFVFFQARHSEKAPRVPEKWSRWTIESCKQCGRNHLPEFEVAQGLEDAIEGAGKAQVLIATQHAAPVPVCDAVTPGDAVFLVVGPEGDFTDGEITTVMARGGKAISLGAHTLRSELAATVAIALMRHAAGRLGA